MRAGTGACGVCCWWSCPFLRIYTAALKHDLFKAFFFSATSKAC